MCLFNAENQEHNLLSKLSNLKIKKKIKKIKNKKNKKQKIWGKRFGRQSAVKDTELNVKSSNFSSNFSLKKKQFPYLLIARVVQQPKLY